MYSIARVGTANAVIQIHAVSITNVNARAPRAPVAWIAATKKMDLRPGRAKNGRRTATLIAAITKNAIARYVSLAIRDCDGSCPGQTRPPRKLHQTEPAKNQTSAWAMTQATIPTRSHRHGVIESVAR